jgi:hypothetical protein
MLSFEALLCTLVIVRDSLVLVSNSFTLLVLGLDRYLTCLLVWTLAPAHRIFSRCPRQPGRPQQSGHKPIQTTSRAITERRSRLRCLIPCEHPKSKRTDTVWDGAVEEHAREEPS